MIRRSVTLLCSLLALLASGCVDDNTSFYISGNLVPDDSSCTVAPTNELRFVGTYDVGLAASGNAGAYLLFPQYNNALQNRANHLMTDPNGILITEAEMTISLPDGTGIDFGGLPNPYVVPTSTYVFSSESEGEANQAAGSIIAIPSSYASGLLAVLTSTGVDIVVLDVIVRGHTGGDNAIETGSWSYNIAICDGCLTPRCAVPGEEANGACIIGQDDLLILDCGANCMVDADCDDTNDCTTDSCNPISGACSNTPVADGSICNGGAGACMSGVCI